MTSKEINIRNKLLWCGVSSKSGLWFDLNNFFSIDIGKFFIRLFFEAKKYNFCRYLGWIRCG